MHAIFCFYVVFTEDPKPIKNCQMALWSRKVTAQSLFNLKTQRQFYRECKKMQQQNLVR